MCSFLIKIVNIKSRLIASVIIFLSIEMYFFLHHNCVIFVHSHSKKSFTKMMLEVGMAVFNSD